MSDYYTEPRSASPFVLISEVNDSEFEDFTATRVERYAGDDGWEFHLREANGNDSLMFGIRDEDNPRGIAVADGDWIRQYGRGFGYPVRGIAVNGRVVYYETDEGFRSRSACSRAERDRRAKERFERDERAGYEARIAALPAPFRRRFERFHKQNPDFGWEFGGYELMCCEDALRIADALSTPLAVEKFHGLDWAEQKRLVPGLNDGHSGNSFGFAVRLAHHWLTDPELVAKEHGALSILVGCEEYGCVPEGVLA